MYTCYTLGIDTRLLNTPYHLPHHLSPATSQLAPHTSHPFLPPHHLCPSTSTYIHAYLHTPTPPHSHTSNSTILNLLSCTMIHASTYTHIYNPPPFLPSKIFSHPFRRLSILYIHITILDFIYFPICLSIYITFLPLHSPPLPPASFALTLPSSHLVKFLPLITLPFLSSVSILPSYPARFVPLSTPLPNVFHQSSKNPLLYPFSHPLSTSPLSTSQVPHHPSLIPTLTLTLPSPKRKKIFNSNKESHFFSYTPSLIPSPSAYIALLFNPPHLISSPKAPYIQIPFKSHLKPHPNPHPNLYSKSQYKTSIQSLISSQTQYPTCLLTYLPPFLSKLISLLLSFYPSIHYIILLLYHHITISPSLDHLLTFSPYHNITSTHPFPIHLPCKTPSILLSSFLPHVSLPIVIPFHSRFRFSLHLFHPPLSTPLHTHPIEPFLAPSSPTHSTLLHLIYYLLPPSITSCFTPYTHAYHHITKSLSHVK